MHEGREDVIFFVVLLDPVVFSLYSLILRAVSLLRDSCCKPTAVPLLFITVVYGLT